MAATKRSGMAKPALEKAKPATKADIAKRLGAIERRQKKIETELASVQAVLRQLTDSVGAAAAHSISARATSAEALKAFEGVQNELRGLIAAVESRFDPSPKHAERGSGTRGSTLPIVEHSHRQPVDANAAVELGGRRR